MRQNIITSLLLLISCACRPASPEHPIAQHRAEHARVAAKVAADRAALVADPLFARGDQRDAGPFLSSILPWSASATSALALPSNIDVTLLFGPDWVSRSAAIDTEALDFGWMAKLMTYDHWSIASDERFWSVRPFAFVDAPIPNLTLLRQWAKLRLLHGLRRNDLEAARAEVRHLARLCASTETVVGPVIGAHIMSYDVGPSTDDARVNQVKRYVLAQLEMMSELAEPTALLERLRDTGAPGYCAAAYEALWLAFLRRPSMETTVEKSYEIYDLIIADASIPCAWPRLREAWTERGSTGRFLDPSSDLAARRPLDARSQGIVARLGPRIDLRLEGY